MRRGFLEATAVSAGAYCVSILLGFWIDFRLAFAALALLQITWTLFCVVNTARLRIRGANAKEAEPEDRRDYGFALGGTISSVVLMMAVVVLTQIV